MYFSKTVNFVKKNSKISAWIEEGLYAKLS